MVNTGDLVYVKLWRFGVRKTLESLCVENIGDVVCGKLETWSVENSGNLVCKTWEFGVQKTQEIWYVENIGVWKILDMWII